MFTLGFGECLQMKRHLGQAFENDAREFETWLREGGFPVRWASPIRRRRTPTPGTSSTRMPRAQYGRQAELWAVIEERAVHAPAVEGLFGWRGANRQARVRLHRPQRRRARLRAGVDDSCGFEGRGARVCAVLENTRRMAAPPVHLGSFAKPTRRRAPPESHGIPEGGAETCSSFAPKPSESLPSMLTHANRGGFKPPATIPARETGGQSQGKPRPRGGCAAIPENPDQPRDSRMIRTRQHEEARCGRYGTRRHVADDRRY